MHGFVVLYLLLIESRRRAIEMAAGVGDWVSSVVYEGRSILQSQDDHLVFAIPITILPNENT